MKCPICEKYKNRVYETRKQGNPNSILRRRVCLCCGCHWTTLERIVGQPRKGELPNREFI